LPVTLRDVFGREQDIVFLDRALANKEVNVATIVAWAGVGKSTLVNKRKDQQEELDQLRQLPRRWLSELRAGIAQEQPLASPRTRLDARN
jgi:hypothetical protein